MVYNKGHVENTFSGYLQADFRQKWYKLIGGIQVNKVRASDTLDKVDDFPADVNPRAGLILYPLEHINIKALYSTAYRAPGLAELYMDFVGIRGKLARPQAWDVADMPKYLADHDLEPEKVNTFDLGANYQGTNVEFGINGYYSKMKNLIIQDRYNWAVTTWDNLGAISIFGLECEGKYYITKPLLFEGSFLFQQSKDDKTQELNVTPIPNFSAKAGLSYMANDLTLSLFNTFRQGLDKKFGSYLNATSTNKQPTYVNLCDVHMKYNFSRFIKNKTLKDLSLVVQIDNLLDEEMWLPAWGNAMGNTAPCILGRTIYGGFKVAF
jgi:outer membrane receptor protein involved in Fe transport